MIKTYPSEKAKRFYWLIVLPFQSLCLTVFAGPLYGFNALVQPINQVFSPSNINNGFAGAVIGGTIFLSIGLGGLIHNRMLRLFGKRPLFIGSSLSLIGSFGIAAIACYLKNYWLLLVGFAIPTGLCFANLFFVGIVFLVAWGQQAGRVGLSTGVAGMLFGFWGAVYSIIGPYIQSHLGFTWMLILSGIAVAAIQLLALFYMVDPPKPKTSDADLKKQAQVPLLAFRDILRIPSFWVFGVFFFLFLAPGFGFKLIVAALSDEVFHTTDFVASLMAAAFLVCYGASRLGFGILSDRLPLKPMYLVFSMVQVVALLAAAVSLPFLKGVVFFTILMCLTGTMFAGGKCLWAVTMVRMFGQKNFHTPMMLTQPFVGAAGFLGPFTLTWALRAHDVKFSVTCWLFAAAGALAAATVLFHMLRRFDYEKFANHQKQGLELSLRAKSEFDKF